MRLLSDLPHTGGRIKAEPTDFIVEEIPAYEPSGRGDHLYLWIEKTNLTSEQAISRIARAFDVPAPQIGTAGMKDRRAVTRQHVSVPTTRDDLPELGDDLRILGARRHTNRLRTGHLHGNRFRIRVRDTALPPHEAAQAASRVLERLSTLGMPNLFGPQRFGLGSETSTLGMALLKGEKTTRKKSLRKLALSAAQALLYNEYLETRIADGLYRKVIPGDVLKKLATGGLFSTQDPSTDQLRLDSRELVHAGPIFGRKTFPAHDEASLREQKILESHELTLDDFKRHGKLLAGTRRPDIVYPEETSIEEATDGIVLAFTLPAGSYATVLLTKVTG
jgi:tRNA pseudouridine13 synthase